MNYSIYSLISMSE